MSSPAGSAHANPGPSDHEGSEGFILAAADSPQRLDAPCTDHAPVRRYEVAAINVDITFNRYLDHDPKGRMFVLESALDRVRAEEAANDRARATGSEASVSVGLQGDAIEPLTMRVRQGECLQIALRNRLTHGEPAGMHLHGSGLHIAGGGGPAIATNPRDTIRPGEVVTYEWMVGAAEPEATHYLHSHGDDRFQTDHGLFGAVVVEPHDSAWIDPLTGAEAAGWAAIVRLPDGAAFREFALYYHEVGDENYQLLARDGQFVPLVDPTTHSYRPDGRALNYRSEPFMNRLLLQQGAGGRLDESLQYSSYSFGDPSTPVMRSYLGDPVKQRVIHAGAEVLHVHHVHGGGIRWLRQPGTEPSRYDAGLDKHPPLRPQFSERTDSQAMGPSETFDVADECGSGGCQQSAGDFMYHCHVTQHYFSGMWGIWRVYNTRQEGEVSTDTMPALVELPDRSGRTRPAVTSDALIGQTVNSYGQLTAIDAGGLAAWVERQLPPSGVPRGYDASVWDWHREGNIYQGEPETEAVWPGYRARAPGSRPPLLFAPDTGRPAYPFLRPHLNRRPPFAPGHGPAPFLDPIATGTDPPLPGANGKGSDCPAGTRLKPVAINAISVPVTLNRREDLVDPFGQLFVLRDQVDAVRADPRTRVPLAIRANAGQDCVDVTLRSELEDNSSEGLSKVGTHIHLVQFDVQASDGVDTGFNYEQTVRPFRADGEVLAAAIPAGATRLSLNAPERFQAGTIVGVGLDQDGTFEVARVASADAQGLSLAAPLNHPHGAGEVVGTEFVRYRWYPDAQFGTAFFHDHVNVLESGRHGLYGALEAEPPDSTYHDPHSGNEIESGTAADIHTIAAVSRDVTGSFREFLLFLQDDNPITHIGRSTGSSINLRGDPPEARARDPSQIFSSGPPGDPQSRGDPDTPVVEARLGDPVALRTLVGASNDVHTLHVDGHWFRVEPNSPTSPPTNTVSVGISERRDLFLPAAGGAQRMPGDYLYYAGRSFELREGSWGVLRVHGPGQGGDLRPLPGHEAMPAPAASVCPPGAPMRHFDVAAIDTPLP
ncbi:MAG: multicopper oxidase domain-containing protein, partial [Candidatus Dormibacteria bacterium]